MATDARKFALTWTNTAALDRIMRKHTFVLRDLLPNTDGIWDIHLDQVVVVFKPPDKVPTGLFLPGDNSTYTYEAECLPLMVRMDPLGERNVLYAEAANAPSTPQGDGPVTTLALPIIFASSLYATPGPYDGSWAWRSYRPVRDMPVIRGLEPDRFQEPLTVELLWPLLMANVPNSLGFVPDYRILKVLCEFSCRLQGVWVHNVFSSCKIIFF